MHVHISRAALSPLTLGKLLVFYNAAENREFIERIAGRSHNQFCQHKPKKLTDPIRTERSLDHQNARNYPNYYPRPEPRAVSAEPLAWHWADDNDRYQAVNITNSKTVEVRIFKGTLNKVAFFKNLEFVDASVRFCRSEGCQELTVAAFLAFVKATPRIWPNLSAWLREKGLIPDNRPGAAHVARLPRPDMVEV